MVISGQCAQKKTETCVIGLLSGGFLCVNKRFKEMEVCTCDCLECLGGMRRRHETQLANLLHFQMLPVLLEGSISLEYNWAEGH